MTSIPICSGGIFTPRRRAAATPIWIYLLYTLLLLMLLKTFKVIPDPPGELEIAVAIGTSVTVALSFMALFTKMFAFERRLTEVETNIGSICKDLETVKTELKEIRDRISKLAKK